MIELRSLKIEKQRWGNNAGKLTAEICIEGKDANVTLILPNSFADQVLKQAKQAIIDSVEKTANDFIFELTTVIPDTLAIDNKAKP